MEENKARVLTTEYGVMKILLDQLPMKQLNKAALVCSSWHETSRIIKKSRHQIYTFANSESHEDLAGVDGLLANLRSQPCLCITFLTYYGVFSNPPKPTSSITAGGSGSDRSERCSQYKILNYLRKHLPKSCAVLGGVTPGVILSDAGLKTVEIEEGSAYGMLLIPDLPDVAVRRFYLDRRDMKRFGTVAFSQSGSSGQLLNLQEDDHVRCLVLIGSNPAKDSRCIEAICNYVRDRRNPEVAIGGGFLDAIIHPDVPDREPTCGVLGLAFCGDTVRADSLVIPVSVTTAAEVESRIVQLKEAHEVAGRRSVAFMFACIARGVHVFGQSGVESSLFRKHFPRTPLLGFFGSGEIGLSSVRRAANGRDPAPPASSVAGGGGGGGGGSRTRGPPAKKSRPAYLYSYATIFVLVSFLD